MSCQMAASKGWDLFTMILKLPFSKDSLMMGIVMSCVNCHQNQVIRHILLQDSSPLSHRRWWNILDKALRSYGMVPIIADRCCNVLSSIQSRERASGHWGQRTIAQQHGTGDVLTESRERSQMDPAFEKTLDPIAGSPATGKSMAGIINLRARESDRVPVEKASGARPEKGVHPQRHLHTRACTAQHGVRAAHTPTTHAPHTPHAPPLRSHFGSRFKHTRFLGVRRSLRFVLVTFHCTLCG